MATGGLEIFATDDPEITSHPANCLMARIGKNITLEQQQAFDDIRYMNRFSFNFWNIGGIICNNIHQKLHMFIQISYYNIDFMTNIPSIKCV